MSRCVDAKTGLWLLAAVVMLLGGHMHIANAVRDTLVHERNDAKRIDIADGTLYQGQRLLLSEVPATLVTEPTLPPQPSLPTQPTLATQPILASLPTWALPTSPTLPTLSHWQSRGIYCADDFIAATKQGNVITSVSNIAQTLDDTTTNADGALVVAQGVAIAKAVAQTADGQKAVAIAYAAALCQPGETQEAISQAVAVAVFCNSTTGCATLVEARATAMANCSSSLDGQLTSYAYASTSATAALIGHCMVAEPGVMAGIRDFSLPSGLTSSITRAQLRKFLPLYRLALACQASVC